MITGGAGFIGSHLVRRLLADDRTTALINLDLLTYAGVEATIAAFETDRRYRFVRGDIADPDLVGELVAEADLVVNCAAHSHVDRSIAHPMPFLQTNVVGTSVLLDACRRHDVTRFVHVSTDEVYGPITDGAADEGAPLDPSSPYSASKAAADLLIGAHRRTYGYEAMIVRPTNTFGSHQHPEKVIPRFITALLAGSAMPVYGDGLHEREWSHVSDTVEAIVLVAERGAPGEVYNAGSGVHISNLDLAGRIAQLMGRPAALEHVDDRPGHDRRYAVDSAKLQQLGWSPTVDFDDGLRATVDWYLTNESWWRPLLDH